jgi:hypothetical protein
VRKRIDRPRLEHRVERRFTPPPVVPPQALAIPLPPPRALARPMISAGYRTS